MAASNLRAANYDIPPADRHKVIRPFANSVPWSPEQRKIKKNLWDQGTNSSGNGYKVIIWN